MRKYITILIGLILSSCLNGQTTVAINGIENTTNDIKKEQSELLFNNSKSFPNNTQLSFALIKNKKGSMRQFNEPFLFIFFPL